MTKRTSNRKRGKSRRRSRGRQQTSSILIWRVLPICTFFLLLAAGGYWWLNRVEVPEPVTDSRPDGDVVGAETVLIYFGNSERDSEAKDCSAVFEVSRRIPETQAVARAALEELLKGPTQEELGKGYYTSVNPDVIVRKLTIDQGLATVDFSRGVQKGVAGSCQVEAIRAQVSKTLQQFPSIRSVIITVEGKASFSLQP